MLKESVLFEKALEVSIELAKAGRYNNLMFETGGTTIATEFEQIFAGLKKVNETLK